MAAESPEGACWMHLAHAWACAELGLEPLPPELPLDPPELPDEPPELPDEPPSPPPPSWLRRSDSGRAFDGALTVCGLPTSARSSENVRLPPSAPRNCWRRASGIVESIETFSRRSVSSSLPTYTSSFGFFTTCLIWSICCAVSCDGALVPIAPPA